MLVDKERVHTLYNGLHREAPPRRGTFSSYPGIWKDGFHKMKYIQLLESFGAGTFIGSCSDNILNSHTLAAIFSGRFIIGLNFSVRNRMSKWSHPE